MKPVSSGLCLSLLATVAAVGCVPSTAQTPYGTGRSFASGRTFGTARGPITPPTPFRGSPFREYALTGRHEVWIAYAPDGKKVAVAVGPLVQVWAVDSGKTLGKFELPSLPARLRMTFTADGNTVVTQTDAETVVRSWDAITGEKGKDWTLDGPVTALARNGTRVLARGRNGESGHSIYDRDKKEAVALVEESGAVADAVFTPDGGSIALRAASGRVRFVNATTGKAGWDKALSVSPSFLPVLAFSPEGKYLLLSTGIGDQNQLAVLGATDGKEWCRVPLNSKAAVLGAEGRVVLAATLAGTLRMFDLWTEREVECATPSGTCFAVAASPDGKSLAVVGLSSTDRLKLSLYLTAFPNLPFPIHPKTDLSADEEAEYWSALTATSGFRRKYAEDVFLARPDQTVAIAARRLVPVPDIERLRAEDLIENLSDPDPEFRTRVAAELERYAVTFQPLLNAANNKATGDAKAKLATVVLKGTDLPAKLAADFRGLEVLEKLGTPAAREHLAKLAAGAKGARLTEAAVAAVKRLEAKK